MFRRGSTTVRWRDLFPGMSTQDLQSADPSTELGVTDHGALTGLADDDHAQYHNDARGDARYGRLNAQRARAQQVRAGFFVGSAGASTLSTPLGTLYLRPLFIGKGGTLTSAKIRVSTLAASTFVRCGLYAHDPVTGFPTLGVAPIADFGQIDVSSTGVKTWNSLSHVLADDTPVWSAFVAQGTNVPIMLALDETDPLLPRSSSADSFISALTYTGVTGALGVLSGTPGVAARCPSLVFGS